MDDARATEPHSSRSILIGAILSTLAAPFVSGVLGGLNGETGIAAGVGLMFLALTIGLPILFAVFLATWAMGSLLRARGIRSIGAFSAFGAVLGLAAPFLIGLPVVLIVGSANASLNWDGAISGFLMAALAGAICGAIYWAIAEIGSRNWKA